MQKEQKKVMAKEAANEEQRKMPAVCDGCPLSRMTKFIGDFWMLLLVRELLTGPKRYSELKTALAGISTRTLSLKLELAQGVGIITRTEYAEAPPRVDYELTPKGKRLKIVLNAIEKYTKEEQEKF